MNVINPKVKSYNAIRTRYKKLKLCRHVKFIACVRMFWILSLFCFLCVTEFIHCSLLLIQICFSFYYLLLIPVFTVFMSEKINELATKHQHLFSRRQNFDRHGLFISTVFSVPILLNCMLMIVCTFTVWLVKSNKLKILNNAFHVFRLIGCTLQPM